MDQLLEEIKAHINACLAEQSLKILVDGKPPELQFDFSDAPSINGQVACFDGAYIITLSRGFAEVLLAYLERLREIPDFNTYLIIGQPNKPDNFGLKSLLAITSLQFAIAHELGHLVYGHRHAHSPDPMANQAMEIDADCYAAAVLFYTYVRGSRRLNALNHLGTIHSDDHCDDVALTRVILVSVLSFFRFLAPYDGKLPIRERNHPPTLVRLDFALGEIRHCAKECRLGLDMECSLPNMIRLLKILEKDDAQFHVRDVSVDLDELYYNDLSLKRQHTRAQLREQRWVLDGQ